MRRNGKAKKLAGLFLTFVLAMGLVACGQNAAAAWQEQYDLGVRYLSEDNYEEAILAFTAAIEIDPKQPEAFIGRGDAYTLSGDTEDNLSAAQADYEAAIALDETLSGGWLGLANVYIRRGDYDKALEVLREGAAATHDPALSAKIEEVEKEAESKKLNAYGAIVFSQRPTYCDFQFLQQDQQEFIQELVNAVELGDRAKISGMVPQRQCLSDKESYQLYTETDKYKILIEWWSAEDIRIEIRPENGMGYYAMARPFESMDQSNMEENARYDVWGYTTCRCVNWQPDGEFAKIGEQQSRDGEITVVHTSGRAQEGVIVGTEECSVENPASGYVYQTEYTYQDGHLVTTNDGVSEGFWGPLNLPNRSNADLEGIWW